MTSQPTKKGLNRLAGKVAFVTGVARVRGMGSCVAQAFAREGAKVVVTDIADDVWERHQQLLDLGYEAEAFQADLTQLGDVKDIVRKITEVHGRIDILVNVAGKSVPPRPPFLEMSPEYWDMVMDRNLRTTLNCCWAILPVMVENGYGKVVNFSSISGVKVAYRYSAAYAASKGAVSALTKALALEMGEHNITVNAILPGDIDTGDQPWTTNEPRRDLGVYSPHLSCPLPRPGRSEEAADLALFLASDESRFITGAEIVIDGGATIIEPFPGGPQ